jgi:hypothetical protein
MPIASAASALPVSGSTTRRHAGQREADRARRTRAVIRVRGIHVGFGHAVAFEHGVAGTRRPFAMGIGEQRRGAEDRYSLVLATPPFAGSLDYETTAKDLLSLVKISRAHIGRFWTG